MFTPCKLVSRNTLPPPDSQRGASRFIHGDHHDTHLPADAVIYDDQSPPRNAFPPPKAEPPEREGGPNFYLGELVSETPKTGHVERGRSEWRHGDRTHFTFDGSPYSPPSPSRQHDEEARGPSILDPGASKLAALACGEVSPDPQDGQHGGSHRRRQSDLHESEHEYDIGYPLNRVDPPQPSLKSFHRSASDVTLHTGSAVTRRRKSLGRRADGFLAHQLAEADEVCIHLVLLPSCVAHVTF